MKKYEGIMKKAIHPIVSDPSTELQLHMSIWLQYDNNSDLQK